MRRLSAIIFLLLFVFYLAANAQITAIKAGKVVDPESGTVLSNQIILVEKGRITSIAANITVPANAAVIDLSSSVVLPGLFDMHTHLCMDVIEARDDGNYYSIKLPESDEISSIEGRV